MADSAAQRKRRSRRHQAGDHSECDPQRCEQAPGAAAPTAPSASRGQRLWEQMHAGLGPGQLVVLEEACRIADRLDRLNAQLNDGAGLTLQVDTGPAHPQQPALDGLGDDVTGSVTQVTVLVDRALSEARQQAMALKQLVAELRQSSAKQAATAGGPTRKAGGIADLSARIAARRDPAAG